MSIDGSFRYRKRTYESRRFDAKEPFLAFRERLLLRIGTVLVVLGGYLSSSI